jgi:hypothetical protein
MFDRYKAQHDWQLVQDDSTAAPSPARLLHAALPTEEQADIEHHIEHPPLEHPPLETIDTNDRGIATEARKVIFPFFCFSRSEGFLSMFD